MVKLVCDTNHKKIHNINYCLLTEQFPGGANEVMKKDNEPYLYSIILIQYYTVKAPTPPWFPLSLSPHPFSFVLLIPKLCLLSQ